MEKLNSIYNMEYFKNIPNETFDHDIVFARFIIFIRKAIIRKRKDYCNSNNMHKCKNIYLGEDELSYLIDETNFEESVINSIMSSLVKANLKLSLKNLSKPQRRVILYFYFYDKDMKYISRKMQISLSCVYRLKSRAEQNLIKLYLNKEITL